METPTIRTASPADIPFVLDLAKKFKREIGYIPPVAIERETRRGNVIHGSLNDDDTGFLLIHPKLSWNPTATAIIQTAVRLDAQRESLGSALVGQAALDALARGQSILQCWCRADIEANAFWKALGFEQVATREGGKNAGTHHILWRLALSELADIGQCIEDPAARAHGGKYLPYVNERVPLLF